MDPVLARRLEANEDFRNKVLGIAKRYISLGTETLSYWTADFDYAYDMIQCYAPLVKEDFEKLEKGHPKRFILPMTATQITAMTTYIAQTLFGQETPHKVDARQPDDEVAAEYMNQLLRWNSEQQPTYLLGYLWVQDCLTANRGIFYNSWSPIYGSEIVQEQAYDPDETEKDAAGNEVIDPATGQPKRKVYWRARRKQKELGGFVRYDLVSPYDFICDPSLPIWRLQEMRFCGHRTEIPYVELERRSKLPPEHPRHVLPSALKELGDRTQRPLGVTASASPGAGANSSAKLSRSAYERTRNNPTGSERADKEDKGVIECYELWITLVPKDYEIDEVEEPIRYQFLVANQSVLLNLNDSTYAHGQYPYSVGEGRPNGQHQFGPSWAMLLKGLQDHVDWLKNRHQDALSRTVGNVFIYNPAKVDVDDFLNPEKEGLMIALKDTAASEKISDVIQQVPVKDLTENFYEEAAEFMRLAEAASAATSSIQGQNDGEGSATEYAGTTQMSAGRLASLARLLSCEALVPQTKQTVSNFQQFLTRAQAVRFRSTRPDLPPELQGVSGALLSKDLVQGDFDFVAHDGTLPGTDARKVAAIGRLLEVGAGMPALFQPAPGNIDPRKLVLSAAKSSGLMIENLLYTPQDITALSGPPPAPGGQLPQVGPPPSPGILPPGPAPIEPAQAVLPPVTLPSVEPPQARPGQI